MHYGDEPFLLRKHLAKDRIYAVLENVRDMLISERRAAARIMEENKYVFPICRITSLISAGICCKK